MPYPDQILFLGLDRPNLHADGGGRQTVEPDIGAEIDKQGVRKFLMESVDPEAKERFPKSSGMDQP